MEIYHWLVLILVILAVVVLFGRITGALIRSVITIIAIVLFAGFVWGTMTPENKTAVIDFYDNTKAEVVEFFHNVFSFGETLPEKQKEAQNELYQ